MYRRLSALLAVVTLSLSLTGGAQAQEVEDLSRTIEVFSEIRDVKPYFENAYGYAVWDRIARGGLGIGAARGRGQVYVNGQVTGFSRLTEISIGLQAGGQAYRQIVFFEDQRAYDDFTSGGFEFDAQASAVAVTASAQASAGTSGNQATAGAGAPRAGFGRGYNNGMQVFTMAVGGLMYQATIAGQKYSFTPLP